MTTEAGKRKEEIAKDFHSKGDYGDAVESYIAAGYEYLGENGLEPDLAVARGLSNLSVAAACLRYQDQIDRCRNLCRQGIYISEAVGGKALARPRETNPYDQSIRGVWFEFIGDFRVIGDFDTEGDPYERARTIYRDAGNPETSAFEQFHMAVAVLTKLLIRGLDEYTEELDDVLGPLSTLTDWVEFKRDRLPELLDKLDGESDWTYVF